MRYCLINCMLLKNVTMCRRGFAHQLRQKISVFAAVPKDSAIFPIPNDNPNTNPDFSRGGLVLTEAVFNAEHLLNIKPSPSVYAKEAVRFDSNFMRHSILDGNCQE